MGWTFRCPCARSDLLGHPVVGIQVQDTDAMSITDQAKAEFATPSAKADKSNFHVYTSRKVEAACRSPSRLHRSEPSAPGLTQRDMRLTEFG